MDQYHRAIIHRAAQQSAGLIDGRLPELDSHPQGRVPMAHIYQVIQTVMECPSRKCDNDRVDDILSIIKDIVDFVDVIDVSSKIKHKYKPQEKRAQASLDQFFR